MTVGFLRIGAKLEMFGALDGLHAFCLALCALKFEDDLLRGLSLFSKGTIRLQG